MTTIEILHKLIAILSQILEALLFAIAVILLVWGIASWIDVLITNVPTNPETIADWNIANWLKDIFNKI